MTSAPNLPPVVAILNGSDDIVEAMAEVLRDAGYNVVTALIPAIKKGKEDFVEFMKRHDPRVIIYDVPPPYEESMTFLRLLLDTHSIDDRCVILTTTNKKALLEITGTEAEVEIVGKPFDLALLVSKVKASVDACEQAA